MVSLFNSTKPIDNSLDAYTAEPLRARMKYSELMFSNKPPILTPKDRFEVDATIEHWLLFDMSLRQIVYSVASNQVSHHWINGQLLLQDGKLLNLNIKEIILKAQQWANKIKVNTK